MSVYIPKHPRAELVDGKWYVVDDYGVLDGPYATEGDAWDVAHANVSDKWEQA